MITLFSTKSIFSASLDVYTWGDKENGVAGHGDVEGQYIIALYHMVLNIDCVILSIGHQYVPRRVVALEGAGVTHISACGFHTAAMTGVSISRSGCYLFGFFSRSLGSLPLLIFLSFFVPPPPQIHGDLFSTADTPLCLSVPCYVSSHRRGWEFVHVGRGQVWTAGPR